MVFSSVPVYLDQHPNWHQLQQPNYHQHGSVSENSQLQPPQPPPPSQVGGGGGGGGGSGGSVRPGSMVDRARLAKIPLPEAGLNCPRCDSTNTKFCYFNNYSLTQPRHFCKACRRYWTRGGALRSVPVGGGCRRNKRSKNSSSSKSQVTAAEHQTGPKSTSASPSSCSTDISGHFPQPSPQFPFMAALQNLSQYGGGNIGSNFAGFQSQMAAAGGGGETDLGFQMGSNILSAGGADQWRLGFLAGLEEPPTNLYPYQSQGVEAAAAQSSGITQLASVKMEENMNNPWLNFSRQFMGTNPENNQYWGSGNTWTEFSAGVVNSSSTSHLL